MASPVMTIDLFCEDAGHESFVTALIKRLARDAGRQAEIRVRNASGGKGRAIVELKAWQRAFATFATGSPDLLVVVIDCNCSDWNQRRMDLESAVDQARFPGFLVGCPDPHVERWCIADPVVFNQVVGGPPEADPGKCERNAYKNLLRRSIQQAGGQILSDPMEYAPELVQAMDLYRAGKNQQSLKHFVEGLRAALRTP